LYTPVLLRLGYIQTQQDLDAALGQLRDSLQKYIDEGTAIILE
jgi:hypothetical protein